MKVLPCAVLGKLSGVGEGSILGSGEGGGGKKESGANVDVLAAVHCMHPTSPSCVLVVIPQLDLEYVKTLLDSPIQQWCHGVEMPVLQTQARRDVWEWAGVLTEYGWKRGVLFSLPKVLEEGQGPTAIGN